MGLKQWRSGGGKKAIFGAKTCQGGQFYLKIGVIFGAIFGSHFGVWPKFWKILEIS